MKLLKIFRITFLHIFLYCLLLRQVVKFTETDFIKKSLKLCQKKEPYGNTTESSPLLHCFRMAVPVHTYLQQYITLTDLGIFTGSTCKFT